MKRKNLKLVLDLALSIMLIFEMFYAFTGNILHELVGALFFATAIVHVVLSRTWFKGMLAKAKSKRGFTVKQKAKMIIGIVLAVACIVLFASSILISNVLSSLTGLQLGLAGYSGWALVHSLFAYILCGACICHIGIHWVGIFSALKIPYNAERRKAINAGVMSVAAIGAVVLGASATKALGMLPDETTAQPKDDAPKSKKSLEGDISQDMPDAPNGGNEMRSKKGTSQRGDSFDQYGMSKGRGPSVQDDSLSGSESAMPDTPTERGNSGFGAQSSPSESGPSGNDASGSDSSICTLCGKHCSLLSPRCNKPYIAGLI